MDNTKRKKRQGQKSTDELQVAIKSGNISEYPEQSGGGVYGCYNTIHVMFNNVT